MSALIEVLPMNDLAVQRLRLLELDLRVTRVEYQLELRDLNRRLSALEKRLEEKH